MSTGYAEGIKGPRHPIPNIPRGGESLEDGHELAHILIVDTLEDLDARIEHPGPEGPEGPAGPTGPPGQAAVIVGSFTRDPADLPPDGSIPPGWEAPGVPGGPLQIEIGMGVIHSPTGDLWIHVDQILVPEGWVDAGHIVGPEGPEGPQGIQGDQGLQGDQGDQGDEGPQGIEGPQGPEGIEGPVGPQGNPGQSTIIVGNFGQQTTVADLPLDGFIPVDWDGPGRPPQNHIMQVGESLIFSHADPLDLLYMHLFTWTGVFGWSDAGRVTGPEGPTGPAGPQGPLGGQGPPGPEGPTGDVTSRVAKAGDSMTGDLSFTPDGAGVGFMGGARIYKKVGTGLTLRRHGNSSASGFQPGIENLDGSGRVDILDANNGVRKAGDTMTGVLNMSTNYISNLRDPNSAADAANKRYVDDRVVSSGGGRYARSGINLVANNYFHLGYLGLNSSMRVTFSGTHTDGCHIVEFVVVFRNFSGVAATAFQVVANVWHGTKLFDELRIGSARAYSAWVRAAVAMSSVWMGVESIEIATAAGRPTNDFANNGTGIGNNYGGIGL
jgi:hypothetical protein